MEIHLQGEQMPRALKTIEQYITQDRKKDTIFIGFSPTYAKAFLRMDMSEEEREHWLDKENVNWKKREEFIQFMTQEMPHVKLTDVFDYFSPSWELWPFLGTIAIDVEAGGPEEDVLNRRYEDETGEPISLDAVVYIMSYENAKRRFEKREELV